MKPLKMLVFFQFFILMIFLLLVIGGIQITDSQAVGMLAWTLILFVTSIAASKPKGL